MKTIDIRHYPARIIGGNIAPNKPIWEIIYAGESIAIHRSSYRKGMEQLVIQMDRFNIELRGGVVIETSTR